MKNKNKPTYRAIQATTTISAHFWESDLTEWFNAAVADRQCYEDEDYGTAQMFVCVVGDNDSVIEYLNDGGSFSDTDVDGEEYLQFCFDKGGA